MKKYRTGIIGLGRIGFKLGFDRKREQPASHTAAFSGNGRILLDGGYDIKPARMTEWKNFNKKAEIYPSLDSFLCDGPWDIIVIAVPEEFHYPVFMKALQSGPALIVLEKPAAPEYREAVRMKDEALKCSVPVLVNHERRFSRDYILLKKIIREKRLGDAVMITSSLYTPSKAWKAGVAAAGGGSLLRDATHLFDAVGFLFDKRIEIESAAAAGPDKKGGIEGISCFARTGKTASIFNIGFMTGHFTFEVDIVFKKGRALIGNGILEIQRSLPSPYYDGFNSLIKDTSVKTFKRTGYFSGMVENCIDFLDGKKGIGSSLENGIEPLRCISEIRKFLRLH